MGAAVKAAEVAEQVAAETLEVLEEAAETVERIPRLRLNGTTKGQQILILTTTAVVGAAIGGGLAWQVAHKRLRTHYEALMEKELAQTREYYTSLHKVGEASDPETLLASLHGETVEPIINGELSDVESMMASYQGVSVDSVPVVKDEPVISPAGESEKRNIFDEHGDGVFDYDAEVARRTEEAPYIITHDEYYEGEKDYEQSTLTYFQGDDVLVDERDQPVPDEEIVGADNLVKFGYGAKDPNTVFVRNDKIEVDFEINRSMGKYTKEVLGFDDAGENLRHSTSQGVRRFRNRDE